MKAFGRRGTPLPLVQRADLPPEQPAQGSGMARFVGCHLFQVDFQVFQTQVLGFFGPLEVRP